jgi:hypothetical protein
MEVARDAGMAEGTMDVLFKGQGTRRPRAIEHGNNTLALDFDQRGVARVSGALPDVGAYEWDATPAFGFRSGFESACDG